MTDQLGKRLHGYDLGAVILQRCMDDLAYPTLDRNLYWDVVEALYYPLRNSLAFNLESTLYEDLE